MFETRLAKYRDPHNEEWDFNDVTDKWERHAFSAFIDLQAAEKEIEILRAACEATLTAFFEDSRAGIDTATGEYVDQDEHPWIPGAKAWLIIEQLSRALGQTKGRPTSSVGKPNGLVSTG
jgi:hypothetical protein